MNPGFRPRPSRSLLLALAVLLVFGCQPARSDHPLTDFSCAMELSIPPNGMQVGGARMVVAARFTNSSQQPWPGWRGDGSRTKNIHIGSRWVGPVREDARPTVPLFEDLAPGESVVVELDIAPPTVPGNYMLRVEPMQPTVAWFGDTGGNCVVLAPVTVTPK